MAAFGFWAREIAGWLLVLLGLFLMYMALGFLLNTTAQNHPAPRFVEGGLLVSLGIIVFRGGIHLLKIAVAARISLQVRRDLKNVDRRNTSG